VGGAVVARCEAFILEKPGTTHRVDQLRPVVVVAHRQRHPDIVGVGRVDTLAVATLPIAVARPDDPVHRILDHWFGGDSGGDFDLRNLDQPTFAGAAPVFKRGEQRHARVHPDDGIGGPLHVARRPVGVSGRRRHAGDLFDVQRPAHVIPPRAFEAESRHPDG
jgi:hypothetical protein